MLLNFANSNCRATSPLVTQATVTSGQTGHPATVTLRSYAERRRHHLRILTGLRNTTADTAAGPLTVESTQGPRRRGFDLLVDTTLSWPPLGSRPLPSSMANPRSRSSYYRDTRGSERLDPWRVLNSRLSVSI